MCAGDSYLLSDSSSVRSCLEIFVEICKDQRVFKEFGNDIDHILEDYCKKLMFASMKDNIILDYMFTLLKGHYVKNKGNSNFLIFFRNLPLPSKIY